MAGLRFREAARRAVRCFSAESRDARIDAIVEKYVTRGRGVGLSQPLLWGDMDAYAHLNNCKYFVHFETARIKYFAAMVEIGKELDPAFDGDGFITGRSVGPILASTACKFIRPCAYPDTLHTFATVDPETVAESGFEMVKTTFSEAQGFERPAAVGRGTIVTVDYAREPPARAPVPGVLREAIVRLGEAARP